MDAGQGPTAADSAGTGRVAAAPAAPVVTIGDVARVAGVSAATVSRVLNGSAGVAADKAARVRDAAESLGYRPYGPARALRQRRTPLWAVVVADVENPFFTGVVRGIEDAALAAGRRVILCNSDEDVAKEADYLAVAVGERMAGVVVAVADVRRSRLEPLVDAGMPVVAVDRRPVRPEVDSVVVDNRAGAAAATRHLVDAGWRRVACVTGPGRVGTATERLDGYRAALAERGRAVDPALVRRADFRRGGGYRATRALLALADPPDALFVANNLMAVGALAALREAGAQVGRDVGIVAFDDVPWATLVSPQLSVVAQPTRALGTAAAGLLARPGPAAGSAPGEPRHVVLAPSLVVRESSLRAGHPVQPSS